MAQGLEARVLFLDTDFLDVVMTIKPKRSNLRHIRTKEICFKES
jgi:asparagine synthetase B (glutamine-hydrolysing)